MSDRWSDSQDAFADDRSSEDDASFDEWTTPSEELGQIYPCEQCGADVIFDIASQKLKCPYCSHLKELTVKPEDNPPAEHDYHKMRRAIVEINANSELAAKAKKNSQSMQEVRCEACGGTVLFQGTLTSTECPYCATPIQLKDVHDSKFRVPADGVLVFKITKQKAGDNLTRWVNSRWFAPNQFKREGIANHFHGVYLPFWTYDTLTYTKYSGQRGDHYTVTVGHGKNQRTETRTRWTAAWGEFERFFDDVTIVASRGVAGHLIARIEPWPLKKAVSFNQEVIAGFLAKTYDVELKEGFGMAKQEVDTRLYREVCRRIGGDEQSVDSIRTSYDDITYKHLLLPTWLLSYKYNKKLYHVVVNGVTGEVQGDRPYSWVKIFFTVLFAAAIAGFVAWAYNR